MTDIHANARALRAALERAREGPMDKLIVLGDLLTYGIDTDETLDLVEEAQVRDRAVVLVGNHDQLYFDLAAGRLDYYANLPAWLRESIDHTMHGLDATKFLTRFKWAEEAALGELLFAHANPYRFGDWTYIHSDADAADAATTLGERGFVVGVFGHTHRRRLYVARQGRSEVLEAAGTTTVAIQGARLVLNPGSIGQPRGGSLRPSMLRLVLDGGRVHVEFLDVAYDVASHVAGLRASPLSETTRERLASFFLPS